MRIFTALPLIIFSVVAVPSYADHRVVTRYYEPDQIVRVAGHKGVQTMIEFGADEHIENVALGDSAAWQITPNKRANLIFLKPLMAHARTNMTVVTDKRHYLFDLYNGNVGSAPVYALRFNYPEEPRPVILVADHAPTKAAPIINTNWQIKGDKRLIPARIYDDGNNTFIAWSASTEIPAVLTLGTDNNEGPVNFTVKGDYLVIDGVASRYVLRSGKASLVLTNLSPAAPKPVASSAEDVK